MTSETERGIGGADELFDFTTAAELFSSKFGRHGRHPLIYRRFASAAQAIRFAIEDLPPQLLENSYLEVDETRFAGRKFAGSMRARAIRSHEGQWFRSHEHAQRHRLL